MDLPKRKRTRLEGYDYSTSNYYYITVCTHEKKCIFGDGHSLSDIGIIARDRLLDIPMHYQNVEIDKYVIMPNHIHAIIVITNNGTERSRPFPTLSTIVGLYKSGVSKHVHKTKPDIIVWQKSFYDKIIRNMNAYSEVWNYIDSNLLNWRYDELNNKSL